MCAEVPTFEQVGPQGRSAGQGVVPGQSSKQHSTARSGWIEEAVGCVERASFEGRRFNGSMGSTGAQHSVWYSMGGYLTGSGSAAVPNAVMAVPCAQHPSMHQCAAPLSCSLFAVLLQPPVAPC